LCVQNNYREIFLKILKDKKEKLEEKESIQSSFPWERYLYISTKLTSSEWIQGGTILGKKDKETNQMLGM
jgi:hypothetical protein